MNLDALIKRLQVIQEKTKKQGVSVHIDGVEDDGMWGTIRKINVEDGEVVITCSEFEKI